MRIGMLMFVIIDSAFFFQGLLAMEEKGEKFIQPTKLPDYYREKESVIRVWPMAVDEHGRNVLHDIARQATITKAHLENALKLLQEKKADPCMQDDYKNTPAHYAAINGNQELLFLLLNHGACAETVDGAGKKLEELTKDTHVKEILQLCTIPDAEAQRNPDINIDMLNVCQRVFIAKEKFPHTHYYFFNHVSPFARDAFRKYTALHCALLLQAFKGEFQMLLDRGASPDAQDSLGFSVLARALEREAPVEVVFALLKKNASLAIATLSGTSISHLVLYVRDVAVTRSVNDAIINNIDAYRKIIAHCKEQGDSDMALDQERKLASEFVCPFCEKLDDGSLEFINDQCGHLLCKKCKEEFKGICPWCPQCKFDYVH